ncbi:hypothetical protein LCGC14_2278790 [marine sediment metagenome]|uniref:Uncharacterized protein n=1 Tax=marine sediment metagenome TaxID=412755 RepID=A0A0F9FPV5_9ZZZZ
MGIRKHTMAGWKEWLGKKVFIVSKNSSHPYQGKVIEVDELSGKPLVWITITDKYDKRVTFVQLEILSIKEEGE